MALSFLKRTFFIAMFVGFCVNAFAEEAPVYDVDNFPPQFDGQQTEASQQAPVRQKEKPLAESPPEDYVPAEPSKPLSLEQRLSRLEQQINNALHSDVQTKVVDAQTEIQSLRGQVEQLTHQVQELQAQQKKMYTDLDKRVSQKSAAAVTTETDSTEEASTDEGLGETTKTKTKISKTVTEQPNTAEEQQIYQTAYGLIKAKKYSQAADTLQKMLKKYPSGQFAANAHYWLGELYGLMGKNEQAVTEFNTVVKSYPDSPKIADAQLKLGLLYAAQLQWSDAKASFKKVIANYPGTSSARLASEQLKQIKSAGH